MKESPSSHPHGLRTLFFTEMWERFSYYGMRSLLVLFLTDKTRGGFALSDAEATAIYGIYSAAVYLAALPGGWAADRILGAQRAVWYGAITIACGHLTLALDRVGTFYPGLLLVVLGTGLLKPNISALVATLYPEGGARRDAGFTIFYMGINLGAALGPLVCSALGEKFQWRYGFGAAAVGMLLGLVQFRLTRQYLGSTENHDTQRVQLTPATRGVLFFALLGGVVFAVLLLAGATHLDPVLIARWLRNSIAAAGLGYFAWLLGFGGLDPGEKRRVLLIGILFLAAALFWMGFEQAGSSFNLFAERYTNRFIGSFELPAGWFQTLGPIFILTLSVPVAAVWLRLERRNANPSAPGKFGLGLLMLAAGFGVMALAAGIVVSRGKAGPGWLVTTYLLHTIGELCLSPVGLSSVTKLAPTRLVGQMMGVWFLAASLGNVLAGILAGGFDPNHVSAMPGRFLSIAVAPMIVGAALILLAGRIRKHLADV